MGYFFIQDTNAGFNINESADLTARMDTEAHLDKITPENVAYYMRRFEGSDDMLADIKVGPLGKDLTIPIKYGDLVLGAWLGDIFERTSQPSRTSLRNCYNFQALIIRN